MAGPAQPCQFMPGIGLMAASNLMVKRAMLEAVFETVERACHAKFGPCRACFLLGDDVPGALP